MKNPWLEIQHSDYENHMSEIGQLQLLSKLTKYCLDTFKPERFVLLGCATGNGLAHVSPEITRKVYAVDINPDFLRLTLENYKSLIPNLEVIETDIRHAELSVSNINLLFAGLILEYVNPVNVIPKLVSVLAKDGIFCLLYFKKTNPVRSCQRRSINPSKFYQIFPAK